jgi:hypothetical protein
MAHLRDVFRLDLSPAVSLNLLGKIAKKRERGRERRARGRWGG